MSGPDYAYDLAFDTIAEVPEEDDLSVQDGLTVVVAADSVEQLRGATLDIRTSTAITTWTTGWASRTSRPATSTSTMTSRI